MNRYAALFLTLLFSFAFISCEETEDFGFPSKINLPGSGGLLDVNGSRDLPPSISAIDLLDYDGDGNSGYMAEGSDSIVVATRWLRVKYSASGNRLTLDSEPNESTKKRTLYLYLYSGNARQEITITQTSAK